MPPLQPQPATSPPPRRPISYKGRARLMLLISVGVTVLLYVVPYGHVLAWPLLLLSTLAHEMGHGLTAVLCGGSFESFKLWSDGSGVASYRAEASRFVVAAVAAGGLVGPALSAAGLFFMARHHRRARGVCTLSAIFLLISLVWVVRNWFGAFFVLMLALILLAIGRWATDEMAQLAVVFGAVQLALSVFSRGDYLFTPVAQTSAGRMPSDVAQMAQALILPYWFWGFACGTLSVAVLFFGLKAFWR